MNADARIYAKPHFRKVERRERTMVKTPFDGENRCRVCEEPLPEVAAGTHQFFHGACRKYRVELRRQR